MKLRLSTLLVIVALIFFAFYYFNYAPCQIVPEIASEDIPSEEMPVLLPPPMEEGVTVIDEEMPIENFEVTFLNDNEEYELSGNVRPDNVLYTEEMTFDL